MSTGAKIRMIRELRGFSQENMAAKLEMTQPAYSRIESNHTKLTLEIVEKLAKELGVSVADITSSEPAVVNFYGTNHGAQCTFGTVEHYHAGQIELYEKMLAAKDEEIARQQKIIDGLLARK